MVEQWKHIALTYGINPDDDYSDLRTAFTEGEKMNLLTDLEDYNYLRMMNGMRPLVYEW